MSNLSMCKNYSPYKVRYRFIQAGARQRILDLLQILCPRAKEIEDFYMLISPKALVGQDPTKVTLKFVCTDKSQNVFILKCKLTSWDFSPDQQHPKSVMCVSEFFNHVRGV